MCPVSRLMCNIVFVIDNSVNEHFSMDSSTWLISLYPYLPVTSANSFRPSTAFAF